MSQSGQPVVIRPSDRVLAEAVRYLEEDGRRPRNEASAEEAARVAGGDLEARVVIRAGALSMAPALRDALAHVRAVATWIVLAAVALAAVTGAGTARAALGAPVGSSVNIFLLIAGLLGVQTVLLLVWIALMLVRFDAARISPLGSGLLGIARWLAVRGATREPLPAAVRAVAAIFARGAIGRWSLSAISHAVWTAANLGVVAMLIVLLSTKQYAFHWETTILSSEAYRQITDAMAVVPRAIGFVVPTAAEVSATEGHAAATATGAARAWSGFLVGSIVAYGMLPRLVLFVLSLGLRRRALRRWRLDLTRPGFARLASRVRPPRRVVVDGDGRMPAPPPPIATIGTPGDGPPVILGLETERPAGAWPPPIHRIRWVDLGFIDDREDRHRVEQELDGLPERPHAVVVVCSLTTTPDRGVGAFFDQLTRRPDPVPVVVVLSQGNVLRDRTDVDGVAARVGDWRRLAASHGVAQVLEVDLDHLTDAGAARLAQAIGATPTDTVARGLETSFDRIAEAARTWPANPPARQAAELHRAIARAYQAGEGGSAWRDRLSLPSGVAPAELADGARKLVDLLPARLKASPKWMAAGAIGGALACVGSALLLSPVAIGALPMWSGIGAAVSGILAPGKGPDVQIEGDSTERDTLLRGAVLHALLLESQRYDEATITRLLDETTRAAGDPPDRPEGWPGWLDEVRHQYDLACAGRSTS